MPEIPHAPRVGVRYAPHPKPGMSGAHASDKVPWPLAVRMTSNGHVDAPTSSTVRLHSRVEGCSGDRSPLSLCMRGDWRWRRCKVSGQTGQSGRGRRYIGCLCRYLHTKCNTTSLSVGPVPGRLHAWSHSRSRALGGYLGGMMRQLVACSASRARVASISPCLVRCAMT